MDLSGEIFTWITLVSFVVTSGLVIHLTEHFGDLWNSGKLKLTAGNGNQLVGVYGNAVFAMSVLSIILAGFYIILFTYNFIRNRPKKTSKRQVVYWVLTMASVLLGITSSGVNLGLSENYGSGSLDIVFSPSDPSPGEDYKLRGLYGKSLLGLAVASVSMSGVTLLSSDLLWLRSSKVKTV